MHIKEKKAEELPLSLHVPALFSTWDGEVMEPLEENRDGFRGGF